MNYLATYWVFATVVVLAFFAGRATRRIPRHVITPNPNKFLMDERAFSNRTLNHERKTH